MSKVALLPPAPPSIEVVRTIAKAGPRGARAGVYFADALDAAHQTHGNVADLVQEVIDAPNDERCREALEALKLEAKRIVRSLNVAVARATKAVSYARSRAALEEPTCRRCGRLNQ